MRQCKFYGFSLPGDQVELEVELSSESGPDHRVYSGIGKVGAEKKIRIEFEGDVISFDEIDDIDEQRRFFKVLTRKQ